MTKSATIPTPPDHPDDDAAAPAALSDDDAQDAPDAAAAPAAAELDGAQDAPQADDDDGEPTPGREAAKWRRQLRETEAQRDALATQIEAMRRAEIERVITSDKKSVRPEGFWAAGVQVADMLAADGTVDSAKVIATRDDVAERFGLEQSERYRIPYRWPGAGGGIRGPFGDSDGAFESRSGSNWERSFSPD